MKGAVHSLCRKQQVFDDRCLHSHLNAPGTSLKWAGEGVSREGWSWASPHGGSMWSNMTEDSSGKWVMWSAMLGSLFAPPVLRVLVETVCISVEATLPGGGCYHLAAVLVHRALRQARRDRTF